MSRASLPRVSLAIVRTIYRKELVDTLRDRRTLATMLLVPMVVYPLFVLVASEAYSIRQRVEQSSNIRIVAARKLPPRLSDALGRVDDVTLAAYTLDESLSSTTSTRSLARLARKSLELEADLIVLPSTSAEASLEGLGTAKIELLYDETRPRSLAALDRAKTVIFNVSQEVRDDRMRAVGLPTTASRPIDLSARSLASTNDVGGHVAAMYLPMLVLFFVALSTFYPAVDLTAGEKERGTLATLLTMPIEAKQIVWGKYLAVVTVGTLAAFLNVGVITATLLRAVSSAAQRGGVGSLIPSYGVGAVMGLILSATLLPILVGALMLVASALARSFRDASNLLAPVMMMILMPAFLSLLPGVSLTPAWSLVPIANVVLLMKAILLGDVAFSDALLTCVVTLVCAAMTLGVAARAFADERVLFATEGRRAHFRGLLLDPPEAGVATGFALTALMFAGQYYGGVLVERGPALPALIVVQVAVHGAPTLLLARWLSSRLDPLDLLALKTSNARTLGGAVALGLGIWLGISLPILWAQDFVIGGQGDFSKELEETLGISTAPLALVILAAAVTPALMEELAFRGMLLGLFSRKLSALGAIILQAGLFAVFHGSLYRLVPTGVLGLILGYLRVTSKSLWPGVIVHAMTNTILILVSKVAPAGAQEELTGPTPWMLVGLALVALGWTLIGKRFNEAGTRAPR